MNDTFDYISRFFVVLFAYCMACIVAGWFLTAILMRTIGIDALFDDFTMLVNDEIANGSFSAITFWSMVFVGGFVVAMLIGSFAILPTAIIVLIAEARGYHSSLFYCVAGLIIGLAAAGTFALPDSTTTATQTPLLIGALAGTGVVGGFIYWLIAGRNAGRLLNRPVE